MKLNEVTIYVQNSNEPIPYWAPDKWYRLLKTYDGMIISCSNCINYDTCPFSTCINARSLYESYARAGCFNCIPYRQSPQHKKMVLIKKVSYCIPDDSYLRFMHSQYKGIGIS